MGRPSGYRVCARPPQFFLRGVERLKLAARHLGFLHAFPKDATESRWEAYVGYTGTAPDMPPIEEELYLFQVFLDIGVVSHIGRGMEDGQTAGMTPILWAEIKAFSDLNWGLTGWEAKTLRDMSLEYIQGINLGGNPLGKPPWEDAPVIMVRTKGSRK